MVVELLRQIGEQISALSQKILQLVPPEIISAPNTARILSIIIFLGIIWAILKFAGSLSKPIRWVIIVLAVLFIISVAVTFIN